MQKNSRIKQKSQIIYTRDYRNAKYQGQIINSKNIYQSNLNDFYPHGFGIVLDQNYTWIAGSWNYGKLQGHHTQSVTIFADSDKMYGSLPIHSEITDSSAASQMDKLLVYQSDNYTIYSKDKTIILNITQSKQQYNHTLFKFTKVPTQQNTTQCIRFSLCNKSHSQHSNQQFYNLKYLNHQTYTSSKQFLKILQNMLQLPTLKLSIVQFQPYLRNSASFQQHLSVYPLTSDTTQTLTSTSRVLQSPQISNPSYQPLTLPPSDLTICLKSIDNSINVKLSKKLSNKLVKISFNSSYQFSTNLQYQQLCKKYQYYQNFVTKSLQGYLAQQTINKQPQCFVQYQYMYNKQNILNKQTTIFKPLSPHKTTQHSNNYIQLYGRTNLQIHKKCIKNIQEYYKRSLYFQNQFINLSDVYQLRTQFKTILLLAQQLLTQLMSTQRKNNTNTASPSPSGQSSGYPSDYTSRNNLTPNQKHGNYEYNIIPQTAREPQASIDDIKKQLIKIQNIGKNRSPQSINKSRRYISPSSDERLINNYSQHNNLVNIPNSSPFIRNHYQKPTNNQNPNTKPPSNQNNKITTNPKIQNYPSNQISYFNNKPNISSTSKNNVIQNKSSKISRQPQQSKITHPKGEQQQIYSPYRYIQGIKRNNYNNKPQHKPIPSHNQSRINKDTHANYHNRNNGPYINILKQPQLHCQPCKLQELSQERQQHPQYDPQVQELQDLTTYYQYLIQQTIKQNKKNNLFFEQTYPLNKSCNKKNLNKTENNITKNSARPQKNKNTPYSNKYKNNTNEDISPFNPNYSRNKSKSAQKNSNTNNSRLTNKQIVFPYQQKQIQKKSRIPSSVYDNRQYVDN